MTLELQNQIIVAVIAATPPTLAVFVALISLSHGQKDMHKQMNSRLDELIEVQRELARAEGIEYERKEQAIRDQNKN